MLMSFVVDDHTFNVDQKLPAEEKAPVTYPNTLPESFTKYGLQGHGWGSLTPRPPAPLGRLCSACGSGVARPCWCRFLQEQRMACEVGLYYVLHITKQRNKNALLRLLPGLGECAPGPASQGLAGLPVRLGLLEVVFVLERVEPALCRGHRLWKDPFHSGARAVLLLSYLARRGEPLQSCDHGESPPPAVSATWGGAGLLPGRKKRAGPEWTPSGVSCRPSQREGCLGTPGLPLPAPGSSGVLRLLHRDATRPLPSAFLGHGQV